MSFWSLNPPFLVIQLEQKNPATAPGNIRQRSKLARSRAAEPDQVPVISPSFHGI